MNNVISIIVSSRGRCDLLPMFFDSLIKSIKKEQNIEIIISNDLDDASLPLYKECYIKYFNFVPIVSVVSTMKTMPFRFMELAKKSSGNIIFLLADDNIVEEIDWSFVRQCYESGKIIAVYNNDKRFQNKKLIPCGFISRKQLDVLGYIHPLVFYHYYGDRFLYDLYEESGVRYKTDRIQISHRKVPKNPLTLSHFEQDRSAYIKILESGVVREEAKKIIEYNLTVDQNRNNEKI